MNLSEIVGDKQNVNSAESELSDAQKQVNDVSAHRTKTTLRQIKHYDMQQQSFSTDLHVNNRICSTCQCCCLHYNNCSTTKHLLRRRRRRRRNRYLSNTNISNTRDTEHRLYNNWSKKYAQIECTFTTEE